MTATLTGETEYAVRYRRPCETEDRIDPCGSEQDATAFVIELDLHFGIVGELVTRTVTPWEGTPCLRYVTPWEES